MIRQRKELGAQLVFSVTMSRNDCSKLNISKDNEITIIRVSEENEVWTENE